MTALNTSSAPHKRAAPLIALTSGGTLLMIMLTTGLTVALPQIRDHFHAGEAGSGWVLSGYTLAFAMFCLTGGILADKFGANRSFLAGLLVFAAGSALCLVSPNLIAAIAGTFVEGAGAALVLPGALAIIDAELSDDPVRHRAALSVWAAANGLGAATGPVLFGALATLLDWRYLFAIVTALALAIAAVSAPTIPAVSRDDRRLDLRGQVTMMALLGAVAVLAHEASSLPVWVIAALAAAITLLAVVFPRIEARSPAPMLAPAQLRDIAFSANAAVTLLGCVTYFGASYLLTLDFENHLGMSPLLAGAALLPLAAGNVATAIATTRLMGLLGVRRTLLAGSLTLTMASALAALLDTSYLALIPALVIFGMSWGLLVPSTSAAGLARATAGRAGVASGVTTGARELGAALAAGAIVPLGTTGGLWVGAAIAAVAYAAAWAGVRRISA